MSARQETAAAPARLARLEDPYVLAALSGTCVLVLALTLPLWEAAWRVVCPLRAITGIPCPTCYGTRAMLALVAGDWGDALRLNPLVSAAGVGTLVAVPWAVVTVVAGLPRPHFSAVAVARAGWVGALLTLLNWIYLIVAHGPA